MLHPVRKRLVTAPYRPQHVSLFDILVRLGLQQNLRLCLDAGSGASAPPAATKWLDLSGNGHDFFRGTTAAAQTTDPTFVGNSGGLSASECWSSDGADFFTYDTTNETWMQNLHKSSALFSVVFAVNLTDTTGFALLGTNANSSSNVGISIQTSGISGNWQIEVANGSGTLARSASGADTAPKLNAWSFGGLSVDEAADVYLMTSGASVTTGSISYTSPSAANATATMNIAARGNGSDPMDNGSRIGMLAIWEGRTLSLSELQNIYGAVRWRYAM